jgi:hypothetical protein
MKHPEGATPQFKGDLRALISDTMLRAPRRQFPASRDFDGAFYTLCRGVENLRSKIGDLQANQLLEMFALSKTHYVAGESKLGGALMEDAKMVLMNRQPWAYPRDVYRWAVDENLPDISEADYVNRDDDV